MNIEKHRRELLSRPKLSKSCSAKKRRRRRRRSLSKAPKELLIKL